MQSVKILSTPSLGITSNERKDQYSGGVCIFQLPLSGSHASVQHDDLTHINLRLSTPSLGITSVAEATIEDIVRCVVFQLPLSGSRLL